MRPPAFFALILALPLAAAGGATSSVRDDPSNDQLYLVDTGGVSPGACHAPASDIRRLSVHVEDEWINILVELEDLDDPAVRCGPAVLSWAEPDVWISLHGFCASDALLSCSTLPGDPYVQLFAERWEDSWAWNTVITRADGKRGNCFFGLIVGEDRVGWRLPVAYAGDGHACRGFQYSLAGATFAPGGYAISWGDGVVPAEDTIVGPPLTIPG